MSESDLDALERLLAVAASEMVLARNDEIPLERMREEWLPAAELNAMWAAKEALPALLAELRAARKVVDATRMLDEFYYKLGARHHHFEGDIATRMHELLDAVHVALGHAPNG